MVSHRERDRAVYFGQSKGLHASISAASPSRGDKDIPTLLSTTGSGSFELLTGGCRNAECE